ncbi:hypothetical protein D3C74_406500 [compost metagenome]
MENIGDSYDFGIDMNLCTGKLQGITRAIHFFVMLQCCKSCTLIDGLNLFKNLITILGVLPDLLLLLCCQRRRFMENLRINLVITDIMEQSSKGNLHPVLGGEINPLSQLIGCDRA